MPWQPDGIWQNEYSSHRWVTSDGEDRYRRSLYTMWRRTSPYPSAMTFDAPSGEICTMRRIPTNTPLQALVTLNDPVLMEAAQHLALRTVCEVESSGRERAERMFRLALVRPPNEEELHRLLSLHDNARQDLENDPQRARELLHYDRVLYPKDRITTLVDDVRGDSATWRYTVEQPGKGWQDRDFDDSQWNAGRGAFGQFPKPEDGKEDLGMKFSLTTNWDTEGIWLRREFELPESPLSNFKLHLRVTADHEVFVNGVLAYHSAEGVGVHTGYSLYPEALAAMRPGKNVLAVHAHRHQEKERGQQIDVGLTALKPPDFGPRHPEEADRAAWVVLANVILNLDETLTKR
jgi:hypothetical protein